MQEKGRETPAEALRRREDIRGSLIIAGIFYLERISLFIPMHPIPIYALLRESNFHFTGQLKEQ